MATSNIPARERVCITCENPSPGPIRLLSYRWKLHGPFFPLLEKLKTEDNGDLFSNGRVPVCNPCANYLLRQWNDYERKSISLPIEKRTYRLLTDERWEKLNLKRQQNSIPTIRGADKRDPHTLPRYNENEISPEDASKSIYKSKLPVPSRSKIPRLAKPRRKQDVNVELSEGLDTSLDVSEQQETLSTQEMNLRVRTTASKLADHQRRKLLRKLAEIKFQEELEYIQRKVRKAMAMVNFKEREERVREIEIELEEMTNENNIVKLNYEKDEREMSETKVIVPLDHKALGRGDTSALTELKENIEREMTIQQRELDKLRKSIKSEISRAMDDSYRRNEDLWNIIMEMNERRRSARHQRRNRPYSDGAYLNKQPRSQKRAGKSERMRNGYGGRDSDSEYSNQSRSGLPSADY